MAIDRLITPEAKEGDTIDRALRPKRLSDYIGQQAAREQMAIFIEAAKTRSEALDHVLIFGPPGLGKTTLAAIIANEMGVQIKQTSGPVLERAGDVAALLTNMQAGDILFIDEIHRLSPVVEEVLYPAMEDYQIDIMIGEGPAARSIKLDLQPFTLIGATTRAGLLTSPLRDRFGIVSRLEFYELADLAQIVTRSAHILNMHLNVAGAEEVGRRARGTPRIANRLLRRVRDYALVKLKTSDVDIPVSVVKEALDFLKVDHLGFDLLDQKLLLALIEKFAGGPCGLETLAAYINEEKGTLEEVIEPYLMQKGFMVRTPRGRMVTALAYEHFGLKMPAKPPLTENLNLFEMP